MATNADPAVDDSKEVTEEDLRNLKYGTGEVETSKEEDESQETGDDSKESEETGEEDGQTNDPAEGESKENTEEDTQFVKEFPNIKGETLEDYARNLEQAYQNSTSEALRLKGLVDTAPPKEAPVETEEVPEVNVSDPVSLYMKQKMDEEITVAFTDFSKRFSQVNDQSEYNKFTRTVATLSSTILQSEKRLAAPKELYSKAAVILGWEPEDQVNGKDKLNIALKNSASISKTNSASKAKSNKSKVTDQMIAANRLMYPGKSDTEIREELEPYIQ